MNKLETLIADQQRGHEGKPRYMIGEQLKEIAARSAFCAELLEHDLEVPEMNLEAAERKLQEYADKNHGSARSFCITPDVAEKILREFYHLPEADDLAQPGAVPAGQPSQIHVDLADFI